VLSHRRSGIAWPFGAGRGSTGSVRGMTRLSIHPANLSATTVAWPVQSISAPLPVPQLVSREVERDDAGPIRRRGIVGRSGGRRGGRPPSDGCYIRSIIACPNPEHDTCFAPSISRAKS
jgi:hypothetical protein